MESSIAKKIQILKRNLKRNPRLNKGIALAQKITID